MFFTTLYRMGHGSGLKLDPGRQKAVSLSRRWLFKQKINLKAKCENPRLKNLIIRASGPKVQTLKLH